jgi:cytochrome P450
MATYNPLTLTKSAVASSLDTLSQYAENIDTRYRDLPGSRDADDGSSTNPHSTIGRTIAEFRNQVKKGNPFTMDLTMIGGLLDAIQHSAALDDRKLLLEHVLVLISRLPDKSGLGKKLMDRAIALLYNDLPHPPATFISNDYTWRRADGAYNNVLNPELGKAGTAYARSVQQQTPMPASELPDPGLLFDSLLRRDGFTPHPSGVSSLMFGFATLVIHSIFRTSHSDWTINETSSYLDLAPLYGHTQDHQDQVRNKDGRGQLWNDVFAEDRLLFLPPAACALLVLLNRNHNYIAQKLLEINERGKYSNPPPEDEAKRLAQDDEIFNVARLVNCGWFAAITFGDYVSAILGLARDGSSWSLLPFDEIRNEDHSFVERGKGNACSVEFNVLYHWHATTSAQDEKWTEAMFKRFFKDKPFDDITVQDFAVVTKMLKAGPNQDIRNWTFGGLSRGADGKFNDDDIAKILQDATTNVAGAFGAHKTPAVMRTVEVMTMQMARRWGVCSLNEFRKSLGLRPYSTFEEWNPDPAIWQVAQRLYEHPDKLELYPGLQAEETKTPGPGAGLCPGMTTSRAILADAIALTRGDRFFTTDLTPFNLTAFGYKDCQRDAKNPGFGGALGNLLLRTLPRHYTDRSTYTWFAMWTPDVMHANLEKLDLASSYTFDRPTPSGTTTAVDSHSPIRAILEDPSSTFSARYAVRARELLSTGRGYLISLDDPSASLAQSRTIRKALLEGGNMWNISKFWSARTRALIDQNSFSLIGKSTRTVDWVRDVVNLVPLHWASEEVAGLPLKTAQNMRGVIFEQQMDEMVKTIYAHMFLENDPTKSMRLQENASKYTNLIMGEIMSHVTRVNTSNFSIGAVAGSLFKYFFRSPLSPAAYDFMNKLAAMGVTDEEMANNIFAVLITATVEISHAIVHVVNYYLGDEKGASPQLADIKALAVNNDIDSLTLLEGYAREALRVDPVIPGVYRDARINSVNLPVKKGERVYLSLAKANVDVECFAKPQNIDPRRASQPSPIIGDPLTKCLGDDFMFKSIASVMKVIFGLKNVRRAPGSSGALRRYAREINGTKQWFYLDGEQNLTSWPTSTLIQYDV